MAIPRRKVLITGAVGGMGRACARLFGATHDLVLADIVAPALDRFAAELTDDGYVVAGTHAGNLGDDTLLGGLVAGLGDAPFTLIHTAGLSPALAGWQAIMDVNLIATEKLLNAITPHLTPGSVGIMIASTAGHVAPVLPDADALLKAPLAPGFIEGIGQIIAGLAAQGVPAGEAGLSYCLSKRGVLLQVERKALEWGAFGARIVSISPGLILTPMGRKELAETPGAAELNDAAPVGRSGTAMDIAMAAQFLASDAAAFITGSDLKVDGGGTAVVKAMMGG